MLVHALPLYHQHGLGGVHAALIAGGTVHIRSKFSADALVRAAADTRASVLFAVPTIYQALADSPAALDGGLRGLRLAVCGSAPLSPSLAGRLPAVLGRLPLVRYGTTESGLNVSNPLADPHGDTIGVPLPGVLVRIRASEGPADPGADGEIQLRGPHVFSGYWNDPAATGAAFTPDGWFRTGDIGAVDPATGHLVIRGRTKEMIISGGLNVYPREVEIALEGHPSVAEAAVAGVPDERWGERVTAWVVLRDGHEFDEAALIAYARTLLAGYKCPKRVFRLAELPRNQLGKIVRSALGLSRSPFGLNVARGFLRDAVSGRDRIPHLDEGLLGRVGPLAGAERGVVGARLAGRRASAGQLLAGPGQVVPVGRQRAAQRRQQLGLHLRAAREGGRGQGRGPAVLPGALIHDGLELADRAGQVGARAHLGDRVVQRRPGGGARGQQRAQGGRLLRGRDRRRRRCGR